MFSTIRCLNGHKKASHSLKSYICEQCEYRGKTQAVLNAHVRRVHAAERMFECDFCDYKGQS